MQAHANKYSFTMVPHFSYPKIIYKGKVEYDDLKVKIFFFSYGYESSKYYMKKINNPRLHVT